MINTLNCLNCNHIFNSWERIAFETIKDRDNNRLIESVTYECTQCKYFTKDTIKCVKKLEDIKPTPTPLRKITGN